VGAPMPANELSTEPSVPTTAPTSTGAGAVGAPMPANELGTEPPVPATAPTSTGTDPAEGPR